MGVRSGPTLSNMDLARILNFGDHAQGVRSAQAALRVRPLDGKLWQLLGLGLAALGRHREAQAALRRALQLMPGDAELLQNLAALKERAVQARFQAVQAAFQAGDIPRALRLARQAVREAPDESAHQGQLSVVLAAAGCPAEALVVAKRALALAPAHRELRANVAALLGACGQPAQALALRRQWFEQDPLDVANCRALAHAAAQQGDAALAARYCCQGREAPPQDLGLHSMWLYYQTLQAGGTPGQNRALHAEFGRRLQAEVGPPGQSWAGDCDPHRRLRVGFVSADLHAHPVAGFIEPVWAALDPGQVEVWAYSAGAMQDAVTDRLRRHVAHWCDASALGDAELAARIQADGIDVLFDLSGHTAGHRLACFARRPAPVQVTWIGYPNTTGLATMDYALCDRFNAPPGWYEEAYVEKFARIPCSGTFSPLAALAPVASLPALARGWVTFGSFNMLRKIGPAVFDAWARVLLAVPGSQMLIGAVADDAQAAWVAENFGARGVARERLRLVPPAPLADYLALHAEVDLLLDTWPYTGGTTTNHALAMGVPVLTLRGPGRAHCQAAGVLGRLGLHDWVADSVDDFVARAVRHAGDTVALAALRSGLRERWRDTPLRQPATVARGLELAVREMWRRWCEGLPAAHFEIDPASLEAAP